jgi:hypothetical protein
MRKRPRKIGDRTHVAVELLKRSLIENLLPIVEFIRSSA